MRSGLFLILFFLLPAALPAQSRMAVIDGELAHISGVRQVLLRSNEGWLLAGPVPVQDGHYSLRIKTQGPMMLLLTFVGDSTLVHQNGVGDRVYNVPLVVQPGLMTLRSRDSLPATTVTGSPAHDDYLRLQQTARPYERQLEWLRSQYADSAVLADEHRMLLLAHRIDSINTIYREEVLGKFLQRYIDSPLAPWVLRLYWQAEADPERVLSFLLNMPRSLRKGRYLNGLQELVERALPTGVGQDAPTLRLPDSSGRQVDLAAYRGKWVLLHFWATWHQPSRFSNRELTQLFDRYGKKGLSFLGVAVERQKSDRKAWLKAIREDGIGWTQLADFKLWDSKGIKRYGLPHLPMFLLIDPNGKIVARNLHGERLLALLDQVVEKEHG